MKYNALKSGYVISSIIIMSVLIVIPVFLIAYLLNNALTLRFYVFFGAITLFFITLFLKVFWDLFFGIYSYNLFVDERGVEYKLKKDEYFLKWEDIRYIQLMPNGLDRAKQKMICFNAGDIQRKYVKTKHFNQSFFGVHFSKKLVYEIEKYWNKPIQGIYHIMGPRE